MKKYIAKCNLAEFKTGEEVPESRALFWINMYAESPIDIIDDAPKKDIPLKKSK